MLRLSHSWLGLVASLFVIVLAVSGMLLSVNPALERLNASVPVDQSISVATLVSRLQRQHPVIDQIERSANGSVIVYYNDNGQPAADYVNPSTGQTLKSYEPSQWQSWLKDLHRAFLLGDNGRLLTGLLALLLTILTVTGMLMLVSRLGGWSKLLKPARGQLNQRLHSDLSRVALIALLLSSLTGLFMTAANINWVPGSQGAEADFPAETSGLPAQAAGELHQLQMTDINDLRQLVFPFPDDPNDVYSIQTAQGSGYIDQGTGELLSYQPHTAWQTFYEWVYKLHTGQGLWWVGLLLGVASLSVPVLSISGLLIWWQRQTSKPRIKHNIATAKADTIILVGSQGNSTWGFAQTLHTALTEQGRKVHTSTMNQLASVYPNAKQILILTATYGDGDAPASANRFFNRLKIFKTPIGCRYSVLGFGDRQFPAFCQFAQDVDIALAATGMLPLLPMTTIHQQSAQSFHQWGVQLSKKMNLPFSLEHQPLQPKTQTWRLISRIDYSKDDSPTAVLRFELDTQHKGNIKFNAGDLVGILAPGSMVPRYYSLASSCNDGYLEICVRKHHEGQCSSFLHGLKTGETISAFVQINANFRPKKSNSAVILIGAGTGIGPLAGFIRHNTDHHPMHLYWGGRHPDRDFLYQEELNDYLTDHRLTEFKAAFSRHDDRAYVQDRLRTDQLLMRQLIESGAQILVCGGRDMAAGVSATLDDILAPLNQSVQTLKAQGRLVEDVY